MTERSWREAELLRLARRHHNTKRVYLLVDPLQGKHIPVSPGEALSMLRSLGNRLREAAPETDTVVGFAETATAVAAVCAERLGGECFYIHTTRERFPREGNAPVLEFLEEHSHAAEQTLLCAALEERLSRSKGLALIDDEYSTGKTLINILTRLRERFPGLRDIPVTAVSVIDRMSDARRAELEQLGVRTVSLLRLPFRDYTEEVLRYAIEAAYPPAPSAERYIRYETAGAVPDLRRGAGIGEVFAACEAMSAEMIVRERKELTGKSVLVLGTEECMLPGLLLADALEGSGFARSVRFHATTRSPIGICEEEGYPIRNGCRLRGFYDPDRATFLYDLAAYDTAFVLTDAREEDAVRAGAEALFDALAEYGCRELRVIRLPEGPGEK